MKKFIIKNEKDEFIGIDSASGGYPYATQSIQNAKFWNNKNAAKEYKSSFPNEIWSLHSIVIMTEEISWS